MIEIGHLYKFTFNTDFVALNGIYKVTHALDYDSLLKDNVSLYESLYEPAGRTNEDLNAELDDLIDKTFYRLVTVDEATVLYIPNHILIGMPIPDILEYAKLMLVVDLGPWADPDTLVTLQNTISQDLEAGFGIIQTPVVMAYDSVFMAKSEYDALTASREGATTGLINYRSETLALQEELATKDARIAALELLVNQLHNQLNP